MNFFAACLLLAVSAIASERATYEVPVPESLRAYARYEFEEISVREKSDGRLEVRYQLPLALTGEENHLRFEGTLENGVAHMKNEQGEMTCDLGASACRVKYTQLKLDLGKAEAVLRGMSLSEEEVQGHLTVSARFGGDMEGLLFFRNLRSR